MKRGAVKGIVETVPLELYYLPLSRRADTCKINSEPIDHLAKSPFAFVAE